MLLHALIFVAASRSTLRVSARFEWVGAQPRIDLLETMRQPPDWKLDPAKVKFTVTTSVLTAQPVLKPVSNRPLLRPVDDIHSRKLSMPLKFDRGSDKPGWYNLWAKLDDAFLSTSSTASVKGPEPYRLYVGSSQDDDLNRIRARWVGRRVWVWGSAAFAGQTPFAWDPQEPVTIIDIARANSDHPANLFGVPAWPVKHGFGAEIIHAQGPLVVTLKTPTGDWHLPSGISDYGPEFSPQFHDHHLTNTISFLEGPGRTSSPNQGTLLAADEWQFYGLFTTRSPRSALRRSRSVIREAFKDRTVVPGMSRQLVARLLGYPSQRLTAHEQNAEYHWSYQGSAPYSYEIEFDSRGRVLSANLQKE